MPRLIVITDPSLYKSNVSEYQERAGDLNYTYDVCRACACSLDLEVLCEKTGISREWALDRSGENVLKTDGQPLWDDHPDYGDTDYRCEQCERALESRDNKDPRGEVKIVEPTLRDQPQIWYCEKCGAVGVVMYGLEEGVWEVGNRIKRMHMTYRPGCGYQARVIVVENLKTDQILCAGR